MTEAMKKANDQGVILSKDLEEMMGNLAKTFFSELETPEQMAAAQQQIIHIK